jgi:hypothetical protein
MATPAEERKALRDVALRRGMADARLTLAAAAERHQHRCPVEFESLRCMRVVGHDGQHEAVATVSPVTRVERWDDEVPADG